jgi:hypothetical protein
VSNRRRLRPDPWQRAPCGCAFRVEGEAFIMQPCSLDCWVYRYAQAKAAEQGKQFTKVLVDPAGLN